MQIATRNDSNHELFKLHKLTKIWANANKTWVASKEELFNITKLDLPVQIKVANEDETTPYNHDHHHNVKV